VSENRKQVYTIEFSGMSNIPDQQLREIIQEAVLVDDQFKRKNLKSR
jgi:hypothetical protein